MTTKKKVLIGALVAAAGVGAYLYLRRRKPGGDAQLGEYNTRGCDCFYTSYYTDGRIESAKRPRQECIDNGIDLSEFTGCPTFGGSFFDQWVF